MREANPRQSEVWEALSAVRDPELDESITELGFVSEAVVSEGLAHVRLRLPTFFCAANFAYLMLHDAREALKRLPGVREVDVRLDEHFASEELNEGVNGELGFEGTFEGLADGEVDELRRIFQRKALIARQDRLARALIADGYNPATLAAMRLGELPESDETSSYLERRGELGLDTTAEAPFLVNAAGRPIPSEEAMEFLRQGRTTRLNIEANAGFCRSVLQARYPEGPPVAPNRSSVDAPPGARSADQKGVST